MKLLCDYGNHVFDSTPSEMDDIVAAADFFRQMPLGGFVVDVGAGEGAAALGIAALCQRPVVALELVVERAARISAAAERFGIENLKAIAGDAFGTDLSGAAGLYLNSPFFFEKVPAFIDKLARECCPGMRIFAVNAIIGELARDPRLKPIPARGLRYCTAAFELD